jgi:hypothetical protein
MNMGFLEFSMVTRSFSPHGVPQTVDAKPRVCLNPLELRYLAQSASFPQGWDSPDLPYAPVGSEE